ncbi:MAG: BBP7 family outer membrane beta-barrel protein, partial [Alphaproteobacteria bacterium]
MNTRHVGRIARAALKPAMLCSTILGSFAFVGGSGFVAKAADDPAHWLDGGSIYGRFEMLYLQRQVTSGIPLGFVDAPGDGYIALRSNDLRFDHEPGGRFAIGWRPDYYNAIELSFLLLNSHKSSRAVTDANENLQPIFSNDGSFLNIGSFEDAERYTITYRTSLNSVEISYRRRTDWWGGFRANFTGGPRFVQLNEKFRLISDDSLPPSPSNTGDYSIRADNRLFGAQLGVEVNYRFDRARTIGFDLVGRVGVYANQAKQDTIVLDESAQVFAASVDRVRLATTMDAGLYFVWEPVPNLTLRAGYELLFINGVALAPQQMATTNSAGAFSQLNMSGNVLYHGASVRLTYNFCYNSCPTPENNAIRFAPPPMPAMRPAIYAGAEFLYLRRASTDGVALAFLDDGATSPVVLRSNDLGLGSEPAVRVTVGYRFDARNSVEIGFSYLGRHKSSASATGAALDSTFLEEEFITDDSFDNASQFSAVHSSR